MESTAYSPLVVPPLCLAHAFAHVPDSRRAGSIRYPLPAILSSSVSALLANHLSMLAIAGWEAQRCPDHLEELGFPNGPPFQSTLQRVCRKPDGIVLAHGFTPWFQRVSAPVDAQAIQGVAIDGKSQRGWLQNAADGPVHALSAFCQETAIVLAQLPITVAADKAEAELKVAPALVAQFDWHG